MLQVRGPMYVYIYMFFTIIRNIVYRVLEEKDYENGLKLLLDSIADISLDTPEAATVSIA